ncbi:MAG: hypothetical protein IJO46_00475, partial [Thermoguttaceae bacterium]|nr:hypothetical protein [Thermoguttaceae bacterium]
MKRSEKPLKSAQTAAASPSKPLQPLEPVNATASTQPQSLEPANATASTQPQSPSKRRVSLRRLGVWAFRLAFLAATLGAFAVGSTEIARAAAQTSPLVFLVALASGAAPFADGTTASGSVDVFLVAASIFSAVVFALT